MNIEESNPLQPTLIQSLGQFKNNTLYMKRDDLLPFSFGGNKARKAMYFLADIQANKANCIVTYGSSSSNHCRVIANMAASLKMKCIIISPEEDEHSTFNLQMMDFFGAEFIRCPVERVSKTIEQTMEALKKSGYTPYFIMGGGHGTLGTKAYVDCYCEVLEYEKQNNIRFDYIFLASGTGTTQAGLVCGKLLYGKNHKIIGISIARKNPRGKEIVSESIREYLSEVGDHSEFSDHLHFIDDYVLDGYGKYNREIDETIGEALKRHGIPLNRTYTGKAFWGMGEYLEKEKIRNNNILFIHTGGTPLFFDYLREIWI